MLDANTAKLFWYWSGARGLTVPDWRMNDDGTLSRISGEKRYLDQRQV